MATVQVISFLEDGNFSYCGFDICIGGIRMEKRPGA